MDRTRKQRIFGCLIVSSWICLGAQPCTLAKDDPADSKRGKIVLYADFLGEAQQDSRGLHAVDPETGVWTKVAAIPPRNGIVALHYVRVSPDGTEVAFNEYTKSKDRPTTDPSSVWLRELRPGAQPRKISGIGGLPIWSPDGKGLLLVGVVGEYDAGKPSRYATWKIDADGSHPARLPIPEGDHVEDWSRDGRWLVAVTPRPDSGGAFDLVVMHPDGTARRRLTESGTNLSPRFSPDGLRVAYSSITKEGKSIQVMDLDGSRKRTVYAERGDSFVDRAAWSPDGKHLAAVLLTWTRDEKGGRVLGGETLGSPRLCILGVDDGAVRIIPHPPASVLGDLDWR
jgi:Tol biopolymer transport system component